MIAFAASLGGCPTSTSSDSCVDYTAPASFNAQSPTVSLAKDVVPIFTQSCAFSSCHGSTGGGNNGIFLGGTDPAKIHDAIVNVASSELPSMVYVKAGDARESYLMRKLDGSQCALNAQCTGSDCGDPMPRNDTALPVDTRDTIRRWIAQGANNN